MMFNSCSFFLFFPVVTLVCFLIPKNLRRVWLLAASYYFYMSWNASYAVLIAISTLTTWGGGLLMEKAEDKGRKRIAALCFAVNLGILFFFKYFDFSLSILSRFLLPVYPQGIHSPFHLLLPVGISFYTFQALSYTADVCSRKMQAEKSLLTYALYVSFFPQLVAGPIERSENLLPQIRQYDTIRLPDYDRIVSGLFLMVWGFFMKMVIADRLAVFVDTVFDAHAEYGSLILIAAAVCFAFQIYCDFGGYSMIAIGCARVLGVSLMENFNAPYLADSIRDFWHRWHISLSTWFRDYLYIPLGGNRKGKLRKNVNLLLTFLCSGLWHGAGMHFVVWGGLHGIYQIIGGLFYEIAKKAGGDNKDGKLTDDGKKVSEKTGGEKTDNKKTEAVPLWQKLPRIFITFILVDLAWIFFRSDSISDALSFIRGIFTRLSVTGPVSAAGGEAAVMADTLGNAFFGAGLSVTEWVIALCAVLLLIIMDLIRYKKGQMPDAWFMAQKTPVRIAVSVFLILVIFIFGIYGPAYDATAFIYFRF
ncbi:MAG: MBOAT family protein [Lachnospiraceae bacterium]|nr:MBOAT family protein [Lachnospiraceae bacterium]